MCVGTSLHQHLIEHLNAEIVLGTISDVSVSLEWLRSTFLYIRVNKNPKHYGSSSGIFTYIRQLNGPLSGTTQVSWYQKGKTNLDFTEARDSEWQRHQMGHMQVCTSLQTDNHASTPPLGFSSAMLCIRGTSHGPVSVCLSVCPCPCSSVTSRSSIKTDERIWLVFGTGASFDLSYTVL